MQPIVSRKQKWTGKLSPETYFPSYNMGTLKLYYKCLEYRKFARTRLPPVVKKGTPHGWGRWEVGEVRLWIVTHKVIFVPTPKKKSTVKRIFRGSEYLSE